MHVAGKIFLILGIVVTLGGVVLAGLGGSNLADVGEWDVKEKSEFTGMEGVSVYDYPQKEMIVMVRDNIRCDEFTFTMTNDTGENYVEVSCDDDTDGEKPDGWGNDPEGWYHMTSISASRYAEGEYTIEANADYELVDGFEVLFDEIGEGASGVAGLFGGGLVACCGIFFIILGGIFALTLKTPQKNQVNMAPLGGSGFTTRTSTVSSFTETAPSKQDELNNWEESQS